MSRPLTKVVVLAVIAGLLLAGPLGAFDAWQIGRPGQVSLVIMLIAAVLWVTEVLPLFVTSLIILALSVTWLRDTMLAEGMEATRTQFTAPFFSDIILLFLGGFVLSAGLHKFDLDERLARWVIARTGHSIPRLILGIMAVTAFLSMWLSNTATAAMMLALSLPIVQGLKAGDRYRKAIILAVPFAANLGGMGTPVGSPPNAIAIDYMQSIGQAPSFLQWVVAGIPLVVVLLALAWGVLLLFYRGQQGAIKLDHSPALESDRPVASYFVVAVAVITALGWLLGSKIGLSSGTVALFPLIVLFGTRLLNVDDLRSLSWDVLLMMGGGLCLGEGIAASGLADWLIGRVPTEGLDIALLVVIFGVAACLMSTMMSNTAAANLLLPIGVGLSVTPLPPLLLGIAFSCSLAMALPISTPPNAIAFSAGEISSKDMMKPGLLLTIIGATLTYTVGYWWWGVVGLF